MIDLTKYETKHFRPLANLLRECGRLKIRTKDIKDCKINQKANRIELTFNNSIVYLSTSLFEHDFGVVYVTAISNSESEIADYFKTTTEILKWAKEIDEPLMDIA